MAVWKIHVASEQELDAEKRMRTYLSYVRAWASASGRIEELLAAQRELGAFQRLSRNTLSGDARVALVDAKRAKIGPLVTGRTGRGMGHSKVSGEKRSPDGWQLSEAGIEWIKANEDRLVGGLGERQPKMHRQELLHKLARVQNHPLFKDFLHEPSGFVPSLGALADLLRCRVDAEPGVFSNAAPSTPQGVVSS